MYKNLAAPDTPPETDHLQQFAETAEDMLNTQEAWQHNWKWTSYPVNKWQSNQQQSATDPEKNSTADPHNHPQMSEEILARTWEYLMTQHNLNQGLKLYGKQGEEAMQKELQQLNDMETFEPVDPHMLTYEEKKRHLHFSCFKLKNGIDP